MNKEHNNPFLNINNNNINIELFGYKTLLSFRYIYGEFYEKFYLDYKNNFPDVDLVKVIEANNQIIRLTIIDSSMVDSIEKSYYSSVNGLIFVFDINVLLSINFIEKIRLELNEAKGSINSELLFEIALYINEDEKINEIRNEFKFSER